MLIHSKVVARGARSGAEVGKKYLGVSWIHLDTLYPVYPRMHWIHCIQLYPGYKIPFCMLDTQDTLYPVYLIALHLPTGSAYRHAAYRQTCFSIHLLLN